MLTPTAYRRIFRASAWYDLLIVWPYATPFGLALAWSWLDRLHVGLGQPSLPVLTVYGVLFANFFGTVVLIWSAVRLVHDDPRLGRWDALGRGLFSLWMAVALANGASPLLWLFLAVEVAFGVAQAMPVREPRPA
ncbi:MAG: hypothetical protein Q8Q63_09425 [Phaeovulum sp.]|uniref:hypothetical protein n=1 Tax=Phaeovulum sp. TaxID=2934796 RepID=UPI002735A545|nr:hypothetical protein [Phaeovulum sp.]MDP3861787.1 hypothetical protein [Phaeovulum sp.]